MENFIISAVQVLSLHGFFEKCWLPLSLKNEMEKPIWYLTSDVSVKIDLV